MYPRQAHQNFGQPRMSLSAFTELMDRYVDAIGIAYRSLEDTIPLYGVNNRLSFNHTVSLQESEELEQHIKNFHDSIEFSACLPLAVVPFLLPLLALLKKALLLTTCIKQLLIELDLQRERYERIQEEIQLLKNICNDIASQTRFIMHKAKFREKFMKDCS